jgi:hypothetical protein
MTSTNCLNCKNELTGNFCSNCGQKADTHRITLKNFIFHDVLHGTFHIDKGILFTAKQALIRPGKAALDYISGKRKPYYNVFYLILITFGLIVFFIHFYDVLSGEVTPEKKYINDASRKMDEIFSQKSKIIIFLFVPFAALNSFMLFKRKKLNLAEHAIIAGMILLGMLLYSLFGNLFFYLEILTPFNKTFSFLMSWLFTLLIIFQIGLGYYNAFRANYSKLGIAYRVVLFYGLLFLEILILLFIAIGYVTHWKYGEISLTPFG